MSYAVDSIWPPSSPRRVVWRLVRDAGPQGLPRGVALALLPELSSMSVAFTLSWLKKNRFLAKRPRSGLAGHRGYVPAAYVFDADHCSAPVGELIEPQDSAPMEAMTKARLDAEANLRAALWDADREDAPAVARKAVRSVFEFSDPVELPPRRNVGPAL